jgi:heat shock protein HslJ
MPFRYILPGILLFLCTISPNRFSGYISLSLPDVVKNQTVLNKIHSGGLGIIDRPGVDFFASGDRPEWTLDIDFSNLIHFYSAQTGSVYMPVPVPVKDESNGKVTYAASSGSEKIQITMQAVACSSKMADKGFTYQVEVTYKNEIYTGCGQYLFPAERLHDIWALEALNQRKVSATAFSKGMPTLEIFVLEQKVLGTTGCNSFSGHAMIEKDKIRFLQLVTTEMACAGSLEKELLQALDKTNAYQLDSGKLILLKGKSEVLRFKKVD